MYEMNIKSLNRTGDSVKKKSKKLYLEGKSLSSKKKTKLLELSKVNLRPIKINL